MRISKLLSVLTTIVWLVVGIHGTLSAASAQANLPISVTVANNCTITALAVGFPNYDRLLRTRRLPTTVLGLGDHHLHQGLYDHYRTEPRREFHRNPGSMLNGTANYLNYGLYQDAATTIVWGNAAPNLYTPPPLQAGRAHLYRQRTDSAAQDVPAGVYSDTVVAHVNF